MVSASQIPEMRTFLWETLAKEDLCTNLLVNFIVKDHKLGVSKQQVVGSRQNPPLPLPGSRRWIPFPGIPDLQLHRSSLCLCL